MSLCPANLVVIEHPYHGPRQGWLNLACDREQGHDGPHRLARLADEMPRLHWSDDGKAVVVEWSDGLRTPGEVPATATP